MGTTAVAFDLDYTLAVPTRDRATLLSEATRAADAPPITREEYLEAHRAEHAHETRAPIFDRLLDGDDGAPEDLAEAYRETIADALAPVEGAEELIRELRRDYRIGLLTNGPVRAQRDKLETLGWEGLFDAVVITGSLEAGKPDSIAFETLLERLDAEPEEAVYVGDEVTADVRGASEVGLRVVQVRYPGGPDPDPRADAHVDRESLREDLPSVVRELGRADADVIA